LAELGEKSEVIGVAVESGVSDQPLGEEETIRGAINRARGAFSSHPQADLGVGLERGLVKIRGRYFLVCVAAIYTPERKIHLGISSKWPLPYEVSRKIGKRRIFCFLNSGICSKT